MPPELALHQEAVIAGKNKRLKTGTKKSRLSSAFNNNIRLAINLSDHQKKLLHTIEEAFRFWLMFFLPQCRLEYLPALAEAPSGANSV